MPSAFSRRFAAVLFLSLLGLSACQPVEPQPSQPSGASLQAVDTVDLNFVSGQRVFVPAYSEVAYAEGGRVIDLTATLAIHNSDLDNPIIIQSVRYYDTNGVLLREFISAPVQLAPMATTGFVVQAGAGDGGWGSNFIVEWAAETPVYAPVIEAVMIGSRGTDGFSLVSTGRVVSEILP